MAYATPTALFVLLLFVVPVILVSRMSLSDWSLFAGNRGFNAPENFTEAVDNRLFWPSVWFTLKYTVITTVMLLAVALGLALLVQESTRWNGFLRTSILVPERTRSRVGLAAVLRPVLAAGWPVRQRPDGSRAA